MSKLSLKELYMGDKYHIFSSVNMDIIRNGTRGEDLQMATALLIIKYTLLAAEKIETEGDVVSGLTDATSLFTEKKRK